MSLESEYKDAAAELSDKLVDLPNENSSDRRRLYLAILLLLSRLRKRLFEDFQTALRKTVTEQYVNLLDKSNVDFSKLLSADDLERIVEYQQRISFGYFERSFRSIQGLAASLQSGDKEALQRFLGIPKSQTSNLRQKLREGMVAILAANGRYYHYDPEYYAKLVQATAEGEMSKTLSLEQARISENDLVEIVGPPSKHLLCAELVGKVFSISGTHPIAPPLSLIGGGMPAHPFCRHQQVNFDETKISQSELIQKTTISPQLAHLISKEITLV